MYRNKDFSYTWNSCGYQIRYKKINIGGAGILGKNKGSWQQQKADLKMYQSHAEIDIDALLEGRGQKRFIEAINKIRKSLKLKQIN